MTMTKEKIKPSTNPAVNEIANECLAMRLRLMNRKVTRIYDDALRPTGLRTGQLNILTVVAKLGFVSFGRVGKTLAMEKSTVSRNVERLRSLGWIKVLAGEDGRTRMLAVTKKGEQVLEQALPLWRQAQEEAREMLGETGATVVRQAARFHRHGHLQH